MGDEWGVTLVVFACVALACWLGRSTVFLTLQYESSPVNWCEENYVYNNWIVEFWNSVSSVLLSLFGAWGLWVYRNENDGGLYRFEPTMRLVWAAMILVGLGSVWFHSTLSVAGQISDEVPIVILCLVIITMSRHAKTPKAQAWRAWLLRGHVIARGSAALFCFCLFLPVVSHVIVLVFLPIGVFVFTKDYRDLMATSSGGAEHHAVFQRLFWLTNATFYLALLVWVLDRTACEPITRAGMQYLGFYPQLHALWHVFIGMTFWLVVCLFILMKAWRERGIKPALKPYFVVDLSSQAPPPPQDSTTAVAVAVATEIELA